MRSASDLRSNSMARAESPRSAHDAAEQVVQLRDGEAPRAVHRLGQLEPAELSFSASSSDCAAAQPQRARASAFMLRMTLRCFSS